MAALVGKDPYLQSSLTLVKQAGARAGLRLVGVTQESGSARRDVAAVASTRPDCVLAAFFSDKDVEIAQRVNALNKALPNAKLVAGDWFLNPAVGASLTPQARAALTVAYTPPPQGAFPPAGRAFIRRFRARLGPEAYSDYAIFGYETMKLALDAIERAHGDVTRADVVDALFRTKRRKSVLGTYSIDSNGDTTLTLHGLYQLGENGPKFLRAATAPPELTPTKLD
jgi:branched-chain amino acid transport system substrate-binding protein